MAAVLVHIDLDGDTPHASSLVALAAGRQVASSWGATLYAALIVHGDSVAGGADSTVQVVNASTIPGIDAIEDKLSRGGADKVVVAMTDAPVVPLWAFVGTAWQGVIDHLRPRVVLFGANAPSATELAPRTGARIGARLLARARTVGGDEVELRDRDGGYVRVGDTGAAVAIVGRAEKMPSPSPQDADIDIVVLALPGGVEEGVELVSTQPAEVAQMTSPLVAIDDESAKKPKVVAGARTLAALLGGHLVGSAQSAKVVGTGAVVDRTTALAPELCVVIGGMSLDLAGSTSVVKIGAAADKTVDGALPAPADVSLASLLKHVEDM